MVEVTNEIFNTYPCVLQVYDTPPTNRWQHPVSAVPSEEDDGIYNTPRALPLHTDQASEVRNQTQKKNARELILLLSIQ